MRRVYWSWVVVGLAVMAVGGVLTQAVLWAGAPVVVLGLLIAACGMGPPDWMKNTFGSNDD